MKSFIRITKVIIGIVGLLVIAQIYNVDISHAADLISFHSAVSIKDLNKVDASGIIKNTVAQIVSDMQLPHEGKPHGVPSSYDWYVGPKVDMGNSPGNFKAMTAWGQVYEDEKGNPAKNTLVEIRNMKAYILSKKTNKWHLLQSTSEFGGGAFLESFANNDNVAPDIKYLEDGNIAVRAGNGYNFHFWPQAGRVLISDYTNDVGGIFVTIQARLIPDDPKGGDDRGKAKYLLSMGADYWLDLTAPWDNFVSSGGVGIGRFKYVTTRWKSYNMCTAAPSVIKKNPPPIK